MSKPITRSRFLSSTIAGSGVATLTRADRRPVDIRIRKLAANRNPKNPFVLVTYASRAGSTMEISRSIAFELEKRFFSVDYCPIKQINSLKGYSHVVIGSAI